MEYILRHRGYISLFHYGTYLNIDRPFNYWHSPGLGYQKYDLWIQNQFVITDNAKKMYHV